MIRISLILVAAMVFAGCQGVGLCDGPFSAYAAAPAQDDSVWMANAPDIRLTRKVYEKNLEDNLRDATIDAVDTPQGPGVVVKVKNAGGSCAGSCAGCH